MNCLDLMRNTCMYLEGAVVVTRKVVHGFRIAEDAVAVSVSSIVEELIHPKHQYPVEVGGFTAWKRVDCRKIVNLSP